MSKNSIGDILQENRGLGPGFDFLRIALAVSIMTWHATPVATGRHWLDFTPIVWFPGYGLLVMFFALSGFLITGSAQRLGLGNFLINRGLRIFPALIVEIALSAFVLGPIFTEMSLRDYLSQGAVYKYFLNLVGFMQYTLPGVFQRNPSHLVNWALWTVPFELGCYAIMSAFIIFKVLKHQQLIVILTIAYMMISLVLSFITIDPSTISGFLLQGLITGRGSKLFISFTLGIAAYLYKDRIPYDWRLFAACLAICFMISLIRPAVWLSVPVLNIFLCPLLVYMTVFVGATKFPKLPIYGTGDYSYGIYLYSLPIQQSVRATIPFAATGLLNLIFALPLVTLFAIFSWHGLEKQVLKARKRFSFVARVRGVEGPGESKVGAPPAL